MRLTFAFIVFLSLFLPAACTDQHRDISDDAPANQDFEKTDWGVEITLDEIVAMAKGGRIQEIQWHVMPNVLRVLTPEGEIFHLKNENKGVDLRNMLMDAGVRIGKEGIRFRHVF